MANAEFDKGASRSGPGGFDAASYRAAKTPDTPQRSLTPLQRRLAGAEAALPAPLRTRAAAVALSAVVAAGAFAGIGGAKLSAKYRAVEKSYSLGVRADNGYTLAEELNERLNTAANVLTTARHNEALSGSGELADAEAALEAFRSALEQAPGGSMHRLYLADAALDAAINRLYARMQELSDTPLKMGAVQGEYGRFHSAGTILANLNYNKEVQQLRDTTGDAPALLLRALLNLKEAEIFG